MGLCKRSCRPSWASRSQEVWRGRWSWCSCLCPPPCPVVKGAWAREDREGPGAGQETGRAGERALPSIWNRRRYLDGAGSQRARGGRAGYRKQSKEVGFLRGLRSEVERRGTAREQGAERLDGRGGRSGVVVSSPEEWIATENGGAPEFLGGGRLEGLEEGEEETGVESMAEVWRCGV